MIIQSFIRWLDTARAGERARAADLLARSYSEGCFSGDEHHAAEAALAMLSEDPSPKVRIAMAEGLAMAANAPRALILALSRDQVEVAGRVIARSPVLSDGWEGTRVSQFGRGQWEDGSELQGRIESADDFVTSCR